MPFQLWLGSCEWVVVSYQIRIVNWELLAGSVISCKWLVASGLFEVLVGGLFVIKIIIFKGY